MKILVSISAGAPGSEAGNRNLRRLLKVRKDYEALLERVAKYKGKTSTRSKNLLKEAMDELKAFKQKHDDIPRKSAKAISLLLNGPEKPRRTEKPTRTARPSRTASKPTRSGRTAGGPKRRSSPKDPEGWLAFWKDKNGNWKTKEISHPGDVESVVKALYKRENAFFSVQSIQRKDWPAYKAKLTGR